MNGKERNLSQFRKLSAYIMQDNQLHANLTVEEAMHVAASLKLSQKVEKSEKMHVVSKRGGASDMVGMQIINEGY